MITELSLGQFKSWASSTTMNLAPICGLFGTNSSGKTSILQLLLMLKQTIESTDRAQVLEFGDEKGLTNLGSFRDAVHAHVKPGAMNFALKWHLANQLQVPNPADSTQDLFSTDNLEFSCSVEENATGRLTVVRMAYCLPKFKFALERKTQTGTRYRLQGEGFRFVRAQGRAWDVPAPVKFYGFPDQAYAYFQNAGFLSKLQLELENLFGRIYYLGPLREFPLRYYAWKGSEPADMGRRGEHVVDAMLAARERGSYISPGYKRRRLTLEERVAEWLKYLGLIHSFTVEPIAEGSRVYQVRVQRTSGSAKVLITDVGFGVSQILPVIALCYYVPEGSTILLEQPEIHLHPSVQSGLADVLIDAALNRKVQIIVESHSEHLLRRLQRRVAEEKIKPTDMSLYFCETSVTGSILKPLDIDLFGTIRNWPKDFFGDEFGEIAATDEAAIIRRKKQESE